MMTQVYTNPVAELLTYGEVDIDRRHEGWPDYLALGFTRGHVADLIRMATDLDLHDLPAESLEVWAPVHAWRALGQMRAVEAARALVFLFERVKYDDWLAEELPTVFSMIGPAAVPALEAFLADDGVEDISRISVPSCLVRMAENHPGERDPCIGVLIRQLQKFETNGPVLNGILIWALIDLGATEAIDVIRQAYRENQVDFSILGDIEDAEIEMGLRKSRSTPRPRVNLFDRALESAGLADHGVDDEAFRSVPVRRAAKVGRNDPCPCGSGKKYKKCCLN
jgi:hypothetical protein